MTIDNNKVVAWFDNHKGLLTYSMFGSRNGSDGTADCSGSVTEAIYEAGAPKYDYLYSTVSLGSWLGKIGYKRISANQDWDAQKGDIVLMSWSSDMSGSGGAGGHVGVMKSSSLFISCDYWTGGATGTAISEHDWNTYYNIQAPTYIEVWRLSGNNGESDDKPLPAPSHPITAIDRFKAAGGEFVINKPIKVDQVAKINGIWQALSYNAAGGTDADWVANGLPLVLMHRVDGGDENNVSSGALIAFNIRYNAGVIDEYDEASNGVGVKFGNYGMIWFDADWLLQA